MKENLIGVVILLSFIGALVLLCVVAAIDDHYRRRRRRQHSMGSNTYDLALATRNDPWPELVVEPLPTSGQQTGDASDGWSEIDADAPTSTQDGSLVRPPPVVMRDNSRSSLGYEQSLSSASWSTPPPVYTR
jgi:hypothetical protein